MSDLVERLRAVESAKPEWHNGPTTCWHRNPDGPEAADEIIRLREALERVTDAADNLAGECADPGSEALAAIYCARTALSAAQKEAG